MKQAGIISQRTQYGWCNTEIHFVIRQQLFDALYKFCMVLIDVAQHPNRNLPLARQPRKPT